MDTPNAAFSASTAVSASALRTTILIITAYAVLVLALVPIVGVPGPELPGLTATFGAVLFVTELATSFLLFVRFREMPTWSLLLLGAAYLFSALMVVPHVMTFPGAFVPNRAWIPSSQQAPGWIFVFWISGHAGLTLAAVIAEVYRHGRLRRRNVDTAVFAAVSAVVMVVLAIAFIAMVMGDVLPPLVGGSRWTGLNRAFIAVALLMLGSSIALILLKVRSALYLWLSLALTAMAFANALSELGGARYTIGWSVGRISWIISACVLFLYFLLQFGWQRGLLRASEQQLQLLVQGVKDYAIFMLDTDGRISTWNSGAQIIKGYPPEEIIGEHFSRFYTPDERAAGIPDQALRTAERTGKYEAEGWRVRKNGSRFWASVVIDAIRDESGRLIGFAKVTRDISERRRMQDMLEQARDRLFQSQKMEAVGQLTGGVAHDFNNLLMIIMGNLDTARRHVGKLSGGVADQLIRVIANARTGAERAATLTQHLLAFSRRQPLSPKRLDLNKFIVGAVEFLQSSLGETVQVEAVGGAGLWPVEADPHQLETSLLNLAVNARDAMPEGGKLTIETGNAFLDEEYCRQNPEVTPGQYALISVSDTGTGMSLEVMSRAFEPFFTTKTVGHGTGLGLSQVYGFVKQTGGHVKIYSEPGQGTTVKLYLPRAIGEAQVSDQPLPPSPGQSLGESILVVEDDPGVRAYIVEALRELSYTVMEAQDAESALAVLEEKQGSVDMVLTDVVLPGINGREMVRRAHGRWPRLKVLYMTGYSRNAIVHQGRLDVGVEVIQKPVVQADLAERIRRLLDAAS